MAGSGVVVTASSTTTPTTPESTDPAGPTSQDSAVPTPVPSQISSNPATPTSQDTTVPSSGTVVTGDNGDVVTYVPTQDPLETTQTETITKTDDNGIPFVIFPGGWWWTPINVPPTVTDLPPPPTDSPEVDHILPPSASVITGTDGAVATYVPTQDPDKTTQTGTSTTTDDHGFPVIIFPWGWKWIPFPPGIPPINLPPPPTVNPDPDPSHHDNDDPDDPDDPDDEPTDEPTATATSTDECTTTAPPGCTRTISYISQGTSYSSTEYGSCPPVTGCASGEQTTTTTTIEPEVTGIWAESPEEEIQDTPVEDVDDDTEAYFEDLFDDADISIEDELNMFHDNQYAAECSGDLPGIQAECFQGIYPGFCQEVEQDLSKELSKTLTGDAAGDDAGAGGNQRRALHQRRLLSSRDEACGRWVFQLDWSGAQGDCDSKCSDAMERLDETCLVDQTHNQGTLDVGCGTYKFAISAATPSATTTPISSTISAIPTSTATPNPLQCTEAKDCMPALICSGGRVNACDEGQCVCNAPSMPEPNCSTADDCGNMNCAEPLIANCANGYCECIVAPISATTPVTTAVPTSSPAETAIPTTTPAATAIPKPGQCKEVKDCMPSYICTGGRVNACEEGQCVCNAPSMAEPNCSTADDCGNLNCAGSLVATCRNGYCECLVAPKPPPKTSEAPPPPEPTTEPAPPAPPPYASGTCNAHIREYATKNDLAVEIKLYDGDGKELESYASEDMMEVSYKPHTLLLTYYSATAALCHNVY